MRADAKHLSDARAALGEALGRQIGIYQEAVGEVA